MLTVRVCATCGVLDVFVSLCAVCFARVYLSVFICVICAAWELFGIIVFTHLDMRSDWRHC